MIKKFGFQLLSRAIRSNGLDGKKGPALLEEVGKNRSIRRVIDNSKIVETTQDKGIINKIWNTGKKFVKGLWDGINWIGIGIRNIASAFQSVSTSLSQFNWNATDEELELATKSYNQAIYAAWGSVVGAGIGWIAAGAIGYGIGLAVPVVGGALLARAIISEVATEAIDELWERLRYAITLTLQSWARAGTINLYINYRKAVKRMPKEWLDRLYGEEKSYWIREQWGEEGEPNITFQEWQDDQIENIKNPNWKAFWEEAVDEAWDSFWEGGYIISNTVADAYEQTFQALEDAKGPDRNIIIYPDKNSTSESIIIYPQPQEQAIQTANLSLNNFRQIYNRDIGEIVADSLDERIRAQVTGRALHLHFHERPEPPFRMLDGTHGVRVQVRIPNPKTTLTYRKIKVAARPWTHGRFKATLTLSSGRYINLYGQSSEIAINKALELADLSMDSVIRQFVVEERDTDTSRRKKEVLIYPRKGVLTQPHTPLSQQSSRDVPKKAFGTVTRKFYLWADEEPIDFPSFGYETNLNTP